jgi:drug/metabolite transporter (DMT)-like permease
VLVVGLGVALLCAAATNVAFLCRHRGACSVPEVRWQQPWQTSKHLWGARWFAIGMGVALVAWLLHVAALALAPITLVQVAISGGLVMVAIMAERFFGIELQRKQWIAIGVMAGGLALVTATVPAPKTPHSGYSTLGMIGFQAATIGFAALCMTSAKLARGTRYALLLGVAAGALFAGSDAALKAITKHVGENGPAGVITPWLIPCVMASVMGFFASARSLQHNDAVSVISLTTVASTVTTIVGGFIVFRDPMASQPGLVALQFAGFACICAAAAMIPAPVRAVDHVTEDEPEERERTGRFAREPALSGDAALRA